MIKKKIIFLYYEKNESFILFEIIIIYSKILNQQIFKTQILFFNFIKENISQKKNFFKKKFF
jgi:hypothetical protein